jgi:hypothetical protein
MARYRPRRQFKFLLYQDVEMEVILTNFIQQLKTDRQFVTVIKAALRLYGSLKARDLSVLYELFPWIKEAIQADNPPAPAAPDSGNLERLINSAIKKAVLELPSLPAGELVAAPRKKPSAPVLETKAAPLADASTIADGFLNFIQQ